MTKAFTTWRTAQLPPKTAVFAIGDIHAYHNLLGPLLKGIEAKIVQLPADVQSHVIFIGDYIDRGPSSPKTIDMLLEFEQRTKNTNVVTTFLCGNHDEFFTRLLTAKEVTD